MSWGPDAAISIPAGTTWDGVTGRTWESAGASLEWAGFNFEFHLYRDVHPWVTPAWVETPYEIEGFTTNRGVASWYQGTRAGTASIRIVNDDEATKGNISLNWKYRLTVDTPSGEQDLFVGFAYDMQRDYSPESATLTLSLFDDIGYSAQQAVTADTTSGNAAAANILRTLVAAYGNGIANTGDYAGITAGQGLTNYGTYPAGNFLDLANEIVQGEPGLLYVDRSGVWQFRERNWWNPLGDPVATIGSLDRGAGGDRDDPALTEVRSIPWSATRWGGKLGYNFVTVTGGFGSSNAAYGTSSGWRKLSMALRLVSGLEAGQTAQFIARNEGANDLQSWVEVRLSSDLTTDLMEAAAASEVGDLIEVSRETLPRFERSWTPAHVTGIRHSFTPTSGWSTTLTAFTVLAQRDVPIGD